MLVLKTTINNVSRLIAALAVIATYLSLQVIHLKHVLQLVDPLRDTLEGTNNTLLKAFHQVCEIAM